MSVIEDWQAEARRMRDVEGMSERAIATALGKAPSTIHKTLTDPPPAPDPIPGQQSIDDFKDEAGEPVGEMPPQPASSNGAVHIEEIRVDGTTQLGMFSAGGKQPQSASLRLVGGKVLLIDGRAFRKHDTVTFTGTAVIDRVSQKDKIDGATGIVVSCEQQHEARITDLRVVGAGD